MSEPAPEEVQFAIKFEASAAVGQGTSPVPVEGESP